DGDGVAVAVAGDGRLRTREVEDAADEAFRGRRQELVVPRRPRAGLEADVDPVEEQGVAAPAAGAAEHREEREEPAAARQPRRTSVRAPAAKRRSHRRGAQPSTRISIVATLRSPQPGPFGSSTA